MPTQAPTKFAPTRKQWEAIQAIKSGRYRYILTGGAMSTAKSYGMATTFLSMAMQFPRTRYGIFRKNSTVIKRTIWQTFKKAAFDMGFSDEYTINASDRVWEFANGSQIWFMELDETKDPEFNKVKGLELTAAGIDEANEVIREAFTIVTSRVGRENRPREDGVVPPAFVLLTCNPSDNWVKDDFYTPWVKDELSDKYLFIPSLPEDNPHNSPEYLEALHAMPLQFRKRYVEGNWDYVDDSTALFPNRVIDRAMVGLIKGGQRFIGVDVAREGADRNIFALIEANVLTDITQPDIEVSDEAPILFQVADELIKYAIDNKVSKVESWRITVDAVGLGAGLVDIMRKRGWFVTSFKSGERSKDEYPDGQPKYDMVRSERYYKLAQAMQDGSFQIYSKVPMLEDLRKDLLAHTYEITDKQFKVESKDKLKKRLRHSPDVSDAVIMAYQPNGTAPGADIATFGDYDDWSDSDSEAITDL